jgi:hypothetical protein
VKTRSLAAALLLIAVGILGTGCLQQPAPADDGGGAGQGGAAQTTDPAGPERVATGPPRETSPADRPATTVRDGPPGKPRETSFDDLKFDIEPDGPFEREMLTDEIEALAGQQIRIRGYILPSFQQSGLTQFVLVRDNMECCFGPGAALYDCVLVDMVPGRSTEFSIRPVAVEGTFDIRPFLGPDGKHLAIFHLDGEKVK